MGVAIPIFRKGQRATGKVRENLRKYVADQYAEGKSIRAIADDIGRSYGTVHRLLNEANVLLRPRGGKRKVGTNG